MDCEVQHKVWLQQLQVLRHSTELLSETEPKNILQHFFLQASERELSTELDSVKQMSKTLICDALNSLESLEGSYRKKAAIILKKYLHVSILQHIRLADIRNRAVFEIYKRCGITVDTYFERYSSPPGTPEQITAYSHVAHGGAAGTAEKTSELSQILLYMQILKRFFLICEHIFHQRGTGEAEQLNWLGATWAMHAKKMSLGDLIWELFLDIHEYEIL